MSDSLWPHGLQYTRLPCPSLTSRACSNSCPSSQWCHPTISSSVAPFSFCFQSFPSISIFSKELAVHIRWPKYWSFSSVRFSPSNEYSELISFRTDWFPCSPRDSQESSPINITVQKVNSLALSFLYGPNLTSHTWLLENHSSDYLCWQSNVSAF